MSALMELGTEWRPCLRSHAIVFSAFQRWESSRHMVPSFSSQYFGMSARNLHWLLQEWSLNNDMLQQGFFSCVCLLASMTRSVNCLGQKKNCTGPFNWGEVHCAGEIVKRRAGPFQQKSLTNQTRTTTQQRDAARHGNQEPPGQAPRCTGRKNKTNHKKPETSKTNLGTP